jgi:MazG family protein
MAEQKPSVAPEPSPANLFAEAVAIMARLRSPGGCPWDREQNFDTIRKYTLEETCEVLDAIERRDWRNLSEELGDLLLQVLFYAQMADEAGYFNIVQVIDGLNTKLVRRHPHVFGDEASAAAGNRAIVDSDIATAGEVLRNWEEIKVAEKLHLNESADKKESLLASVPRSLPALAEAAKIGSRAAKVHFDWPHYRGLIEKLAEETAELEAELVKPPEAANHAAIEDELGDLLFTAANLARHLKLDPEMALRKANLKFRNRFRHMEESATQTLEKYSAEELELLWSEAKIALKSSEGKSL